MLSKIIFISFISALTVLSLARCSKVQEVESYAPGILPRATITNITANGGGSLYCSISGGCPIQLTGTNFYKKARVFVGSYECEDVVVSDDFTTIDCNVGPGQNGVYDISVKNIDNQFSQLADGVSSTAIQFSYASFLYVGSQNSPGDVYGFAQHPTTGALITVSGSPFTTGGNGTYGVAISLNNRFLYATNVSSNTITVYSINPLTGALSMVSSPMTTDSTRPNGLFVHPTGQYLYVSNFTGNNMSAYRIGSDGLLSQVTGSPFSASGAQRLNGVTGTADGAYLYAAAGGVASGTNGIVAYSIDQSTGALTVLPGTPFKTSNGATNARGDGISIHPNGRWVYMGLYGQRSMASWEINASTGTLTPINAVSNTVAPGYNDDGGSASIVSADGLYLYGTAYSRTNEANSEKIITYTIDQTTGAVSRITDVSTEGGPNDIRIDTTGNYAYTCNTVSSPSISAYSVNKTTGALTPLTPAYYSIPTSSYGPGIMVMQINR